MPVRDNGACCQHEVQFYFDDRFLVHSICNLALAELERGGCAIIIATRPHRESIAEELQRSQVNLPAAIEEGRYIALDAAETLAQFSINGLPDEGLFREVIGGIVSGSAMIASRTNARVIAFGEMVALLWQRGEAESALRLEQFWNKLAESHSFQLRCAYPIASFDREVHNELFSRICSEHHVVIPAEDYSSLDNENDRLRSVARLQQTEQALRTETAARRSAQAQIQETQQENQQLTAEIRKREAREDELRRFTRRLLSARDEEQRRIAAELHENTAQLLAALKLYFGVLYEEKASLNPRLASIVASSRSVSDSLLGEISKLARLLHPPTLDDIGLGAALQEYADQLTASSAAKVELRIPADLGRFNRGLETAVFRIVEEALANVCLQQQAQAATVRLARTASKLFLEVKSRWGGAESDREGCRAAARILGIQERVLERGGTVQFTSDGSGALLVVTLPLDAPNREPKPAQSTSL